MHIIQIEISNINEHVDGTSRLLLPYREEFPRLKEIPG